MLRYFRINDPYRLIGVLVLLILCFLPLFIDPPNLTMAELKNFVLTEKMRRGFTMYADIIDPTGPLTGSFLSMVYAVVGESRLAWQLLGFFIIFFQAALLGILFIDKKAFPESTYVPPLIFGVLFLFSFDAHFLSGELAGSVFLILALNSLFKEMEFREQRFEYVFNTGLFLGIASLFIFSYAVFLLGTLICLVLFTRITGAKFVLTIVGFLMPHLLLFSIYYIRDASPALWAYHYLPNLSFARTAYFSTSGLLLLVLLPMVYVLASFVLLNRESRLTKYQSQLLQVMFFWLVFGLLQVLYAKDLRPQSFITLIPSACFFITHFLLIIRRRRLAEIAFSVLLVSVIALGYAARYDVVPLIDYSAMKVNAEIGAVKQKRIVVLTDKIERYHENTLATPFFNWKLSEPILTEPDVYANVLAVYHGFKADLPDVIYDPDALMPPFFARIPELKKMYKPSEEGYRRISN